MRLDDTEPAGQFCQPLRVCNVSSCRCIGTWVWACIPDTSYQVSRASRLKISVPGWNPAEGRTLDLSAYQPVHRETFLFKYILEFGGSSFSIRANGVRQTTGPRRNDDAIREIPGVLAARGAPGVAALAPCFRARDIASSNSRVNFFADFSFRSACDRRFFSLRTMPRSLMRSCRCCSSLRDFCAVSVFRWCNKSPEFAAS